MSPLQFFASVHIVKRRKDQARGIQWSLSKHLEDIDFADDVALLSQRHNNMTQKLESMRETAAMTGLKINVQKTKSLRVNQRNNTNFDIGGDEIQDIEKFTYLGSIVSSEGGTDQDIVARIGKATTAFHILRPIWRSRAIFVKTKLRIFNTNVKSVLLCGSDQNKSQETKGPIIKNKLDTHNVKDEGIASFVLKSSKDVRDNTEEGTWYSDDANAHDSLADVKYIQQYLKLDFDNLSNTYYSLGDFKKAIEYHERHLKIAKEVGDRAGEGKSYGNLGNAYRSLGDFKKAIEYHERDLKIAKEVGDRAGEGKSYCNLGNAYFSLGDFKKAIEYHERHLKLAKEVGDRAGEGKSYGNLGNAYYSLGDFKKAIEYHERHLKIAKEVGDRAGEGKSYCNLGNAYRSLGDFKKAIEYHERHLKIAKEVGDRAGEGKTYGNLGNAYDSLGDFKKAIEYHERDLKIAKEVGDRAGEGKSYCNLGNAYDSLGDYKKAIEYHERHLKIAKEVGDRAGEGKSYCNLGNAYYSLGGFKKAIEYHERDLKIAKEVGDRAGEGKSYCNLGNAYYSLGDFKKAIEYHERDLKIAKEVGDRAGAASSFHNLGQIFELERSPLKAIDCYYSSVRIFNDVRHRLLSKDEWKISYRNMHNVTYTCLWQLLLKQGKVVEALFAAEQGRAQALQDLMNSKYATQTIQKTEEMNYEAFSCLPSNTVFMAADKRENIFWIIQNGKNVQLRRRKIGDNSSEDGATTVAESLIHNALANIGVRSGVKCEDRSLDRMSDEDLSNKRCDQTISQPTHFEPNPLKALYDVIIAPISDLIHGNELLLVPEGSLCLAPYAAFVDCNLNYLCDAFKIRVIPSLSSLKLIADSSPDYHRKSGALLVGDPCLKEVLYQGRNLTQLPCAKAEVEMIGEILHTTPLTGIEATKDDVLGRLSSVALVHIAAHGRMETGEIALAPNTSRASQIPEEEDFLLTMKDVLNVQLRARLVVLSCCHSGRGEIKAEGVVGIARAFLGAGARSVLVSLWAIDDEATLEFMKSFYSYLAEKKKCQ
ncbi:hypothetical protein ACROYT_G027358 [Oculina patagonica]